MNTTSIKDVSASANFFPVNAGSAANAVQPSFQEIWSNQAGRNNASDRSEAFEAAKKQSGNAEKSRMPGESLRGRKVEVKEPKKETSFEAEGMDGQKLEETMEVLGEAAVQLMQEIADTFGISMEELQQLMADMGMSEIDVFNPGRLSELLLKAGGAEDAMALLTDEALLKDFQTLMNRGEEVLTEAGINAELLQRYADVMSDDAQEPDIQIEIDRTVSETDKGAEQSTEPVPLFSDEKAIKQENGSADSAAEGRDSAEGGREQSGNLLLQNLKNDNMNVQLQQAAGVQQWDADTQDIMRQIMDYMKIQVKPDMSNLEMQLHPENLGTLQIHVASRGGTITANFVAQNETVKAVLEGQMVQLKESFAEQGVKVEAIEISVQTQQLAGNLEQGAEGRGQEMTEKKSRTRRINLNAALDVEEEASAEEQLAADIMRTNGSTVDYTA